MIKLVALSFAAFVVFVGFSIPFLIPGGLGLIVGSVIVVVGSIVLWFAEVRTKESLQANTTWNGLMKADGDCLVEREEAD